MASRSEPARPVGLAPRSRVEGAFRPHGSKSLAQRLLLAAALAEGTTRLAGLPRGDDVVACLTLLERSGIPVEAPECEVRVLRGASPARGRRWPGAKASAGESGTLARLATALFALCGAPGERFVLRAEGSLRRRSSAPLFAALARAGARLEPLAEAGGWPVVIRPSAGFGDLALCRPVSSQELSALLLAAAAHAGLRRVRVEGPLPSRPYAELTRRVLACFGADASAPSEGSDGSTWSVTGALRAPRETVTVEPDASAAAVALAAACLSGGELAVEGLGADALQGDVRVVEHLRGFGCAASADGGRLVATGAPETGARLDLSGEPDLAPVLAVVAADAARRSGETSVLAGLATLPGKESDRLAVLVAGLRAVGFAAEAQEGERLVVGPPASGGLRGATLDPAGDHRMAFAFALLGLLVEGVRVRDPGCVAKSWPGFWDDLARLGAVRI